MYKHRFSIVACARWESEDIVEWLEYHRHIGFDHFYIYSNDDDPNDLFKVLLPYILGPDPVVTYTHWSTLGAQSEMYANFLRFRKAETRWAMFLDIDEFVTLRKSETIEEFLDGFSKDVDCIYFNWLMYGNNGKLNRDKNSILGSLTRRASLIDVHTKMLWRTHKVTEALAREGAQQTRNAYTHFFDGYKFENFTSRDVLNRPVDGYAKDFPHAAHAAIGDPVVNNHMIATAYVAHFIIKSEEDFLRRVKRGGFAAQVTWKDKYESGEYRSLLDDFNRVEDQHLARIWGNIVLGRIITGRND